MKWLAYAKLFQGRKLYRFYSRPKNKSFTSFGTILCVAIGIYFCANSFLPTIVEQKDDRIFVEGLSINIYRSSPPIAAREDLDLDIQSLVVATPEKTESNQTPEAPSIIPSAPTLLHLSEAMPLEPAAELKTQLINQPTHEPEKAIYISDPKGGTILVHKTQTLNLAELNITREEIARALAFPATIQDSKVQSASVQPGRQPKIYRPQALREENRSPADLALAAPTTPPPTKPILDKPVALVQDTGGPQGDDIKNIMLMGTVELDSGLAWTGARDQLALYREVSGMRLEVGQIRVRDGWFELFVSDLTGELVAELRSPYGQILGDGRYNLTELSAHHLKGLHRSKTSLSGFQMVIRPARTAITGQVTNVDMPTSAIEKASVEISQSLTPIQSAANGTFTESRVLATSNSLARFASVQAWDTLAFLSSGANVHVNMFSERFLTSLRQTTRLSINGNAGIIFGHITNSLVGAQVELTTGDINTRPVYFNALGVPDLSITSMTDNGLFAFFDVTPGIHAIKVNLATESSDLLLVPVDAKTVTQIQVDGSGKNKKPLQVFDAFQPQAGLKAQVALMNRSEILETDDYGKIETLLSRAASPAVLDIDAGTGYEYTRVTTIRNATKQLCPILKIGWLEAFRGASKTNINAVGGVIVGFVSTEVPYTATSNTRSEKVVYFDSGGKPLRQNLGQPGGGFVIFNVPDGLQSVVLTGSATQALLIPQLVDHGVVNTLAVELR